MPIVTADSYGLDHTGSVDVTADLAAAINAQPSGTTFQLHADGVYRTFATSTGPTWTAPGIEIDGQGAAIARLVPRIGSSIANRGNQVALNGAGQTVRNLRVVGFRRDSYLGGGLTPVAGSPTISGSTIELAAQNDEVRIPQALLDYSQRLGTYSSSETPFYFRDVDGNVNFEAVLSDSNHVANDCVFAIVNHETNAVLASQILTLTGTPTNHTFAWALPDANLGTRLRITVRKATASANTIVVTSMVAYNECGYRNKNGTAFTGGDEFSAAFKPQASDITIEDCHVEGPDGDAYNLTNAGPNFAMRRCTSRGNGRQAVTVEFSLGPTLIEDCYFREPGRAGVDFEPNTRRPNYATIIRRCTFENVRNYTLAMNKYDLNNTGVFEDILSISAGMGGWYGGGTGITVTNFVHLATTRNDADRVLNGGRAGIDALVFCDGATMTGFQTVLGIWIAGPGSTLPDGTAFNKLVSRNTTINDAASTAPTIDPHYFIDAPNSFIYSNDGPPPPPPPPVDAGWDSTGVLWDDPVIPWDAEAGSTGTSSQPAFQGDAFQVNAFQARLPVSGTIAQYLAGFDQGVVGVVAQTAPIAQDAPAFNQAGEAAVVIGGPAAQSIAFTQALETDLIVRGAIGHITQAYQDDVFQGDAFQSQPDAAIDAPAFGQRLTGGVAPHGANIGGIVQRFAAFTQALAEDSKVRAAIAQRTAAFSQHVAVYQHPTGRIVQRGPAFTQHLTERTSSPFVSISQTMAAFTQHLSDQITSWDEWKVSSGSEWPVSTSEEWLVRR